MIDSLHELRSRIGHLRDFLDDAEAVDALAGSELRAYNTAGEEARDVSPVVRLRSSKIDRRVQTYVAGVILLYGLFEQYVEDELIAYVEALNSIVPSFDALPEKIKKAHTSLSAQLLMNRELDKYRDRCSEEDIIVRMHTCVSGTSFRLNSLAFTDHKSNFRIDSLNQFFEGVGVGGMSGLIRQQPEFDAYSATKSPGETIDGLKDQIVFADLDDLVWRRNVVAHGWPDSTLSVAMMKERTAFIQVLADSIYQVLRQSFLGHLVKHRGHPLPRPVTVFNNSIVCFHLDTGCMSTGSHIVARASNGRFLEGKIVSLEVDHVPREKVCAPPLVDVGCQVDFRAKENQYYFIIEQ